MNHVPDVFGDVYGDDHGGREALALTLASFRAILLRRVGRRHWRQPLNKNWGLKAQVGWSRILLTTGLPLCGILDCLSVATYNYPDFGAPTSCPQKQ